MLATLICRLANHRVNRRHVWNDGLDFRTNCRRCGEPLLREASGWRRFDSERDTHPMRSGHPNHRG